MSINLDKMAQDWDLQGSRKRGRIRNTWGCKGDKDV